MKQQPLSCPACQSTGNHSIPPMVDISADPTQKARMLGGSFFEWVCKSCGGRFFVDEVFLCCDSVHGFCIYLVPGCKQDTLPVPTIYKSRCAGMLRVTSSYVDFVEKLKILDAGLDDRIIEAIKAFYVSACQQADGQQIYNIVFEALRPDGQLGFAVFLKEQDVSVDIPANAYAQAKSQLAPLLPDTSENVFYKIDQNWLAKALCSEPRHAH